MKYQDTMQYLHPRRVKAIAGSGFTSVGYPGPLRYRDSKANLYHNNSYKRTLATNLKKHSAHI
jgi:hypothetical protein